MKNKLYLLIHDNPNIQERITTVTEKINVLMSYFKTNPYSLECLDLLVLNSNEIILKKPIYEGIKIDKTHIIYRNDLRKSFKNIIKHINSESKDKIKPIILCFSFVIADQDFIDEVYELNHITQGVNLITSSKYFNHYKRYVPIADNLNSKRNIASLNLLDSFDVGKIKHIFSDVYLDIECNFEFDDQFDDEFPLPPDFVEDIF